MRRKLFARIAITILSLGLITLQMKGAAIQLLGAFPEAPAIVSEANAVSADGSVVAGRALNSTGEREAFRWENGVMIPLGRINGDWGFLVTAMSADASVIAGLTFSLDVFQWQDGTLMKFTDGTTEGVMGFPDAFSDDGSVVAGSDSLAQNKATRRVNGVVEDLGLLPGDNGGGATGISADGSVVVGFSRNTATEINQAFRWETGVMTPLGFLDGDVQSVASDVSSDGSVVVGTSTSEALVKRAFRWENNSMVALPMVSQDLEFDFTQSEAIAVSGDGRIIVGRLLYPTLKSVLWSAENQYTPVLLEQLVDLSQTGFHQINGVKDISQDGSTIVGTGSGNASEGFRLLLNAQTWAGYLVEDDAKSVNTGAFIGWIDISAAPWIYIYALQKYVYLPEEFVTASGAWTWIGP